MPRIALTSTRPEEHGNYVRWLRRLAPEADIRFVTRSEDVTDALDDCDGLLLPGGGDPDPLLYGHEELRPLCSIDDARDALELAAIRHAVGSGLPMLGICRGLQIMNVALGGTLIADLPQAGYDGHHRITDEDRVHDVRIETGSMLENITGERQGWVNSAHHQGVDIVAPRLSVAARSADGLAEALEWKSPVGKPFLLCLHWHPERLPDAHPLADCIGEAFLSSLASR
jgi:putative glutamine amidotransferase